MNERRPIETEKKYTAEDLLEAFRHGRTYEHHETECDLDYSELPEKNRPFWEWLKIKFGEK